MKSEILDMRYTTPNTLNSGVYPSLSPSAAKLARTGDLDATIKGVLIITYFQIHSILTNKPNFRNAKMNITIDMTSSCGILPSGSGQKTNPIQTQLKPKQTQFNPIQTQNKPNSKPICILAILPRLTIRIFYWTAGAKRLKCNQRYMRGKNMTPKQNHLAAVGITLVAAIICQAEFQINTHTTNKQENPAIAMDGAGNFIVVWNSYLQDKSSNGIFGQRCDKNCTPLGEEIQINTTSGGNQKEPSVAMDTAGYFIVVWQGPGTAEADKEDIFARRFGKCVIVWESANVPEDGKKAICSKLYDSNGLKIGTEFVANDGPSDGRYPNAAIDSQGNFAVVWMQDKSSNSIIGSGSARLRNHRFQ